MSRASEELALRKQLLVMRASVQRLRTAQLMGVLHEELRMPRLATSALRSRAVRSMLIAAVALVAGRTRVARVLRMATVVLGAASLARQWSAQRDAPGAGGAPPAS